MTFSASSLALVHAERRGLVVPLWPVMWTVVLTAALWLRLAALDVAPLSPGEAASALQAHAIWRGAAQEYNAGPLLPNVLSVWFGLFTAADGPARGPSALAGWALCLTPLLFRRALGWGAALVSSLLLAITPIDVLASRSCDAAAFVALALASGVGCCVIAFERPDGRWLFGAASALVAGLAASPAFVGQCLAALVAAAICAPPVPGGAHIARAWLPRAVAVGSVTALAVDTLLLTRPSGLQAGLIDPFPTWLASLGLASPALFAGGLLALAHLALLGLALTGIVAARRTPLGRFLSTWTFISLLLAMLTRSPDLGAFTTSTVPLALLGGLGLAPLDRFRHIATPRVWLTSFALLLPLGFLFLATNAGINRGAMPGVSTLMIAAAGWVAIVLVAGAWMDRRGWVAALGIGALAVALAFQVSFLTRLNFSGPERGAPVLMSEASRAEIRIVEDRARDWWRQDPSAPIRVDASLRPLLAWSLRDGPPIEWVTAPPTSPERAILGGSTSTDRPAGTWLRLPVAERYPAPNSTPSLSEWWRWIVHRQPFVRPEPYAILISQ